MKRSLPVVHVLLSMVLFLAGNARAAGGNPHASLSGGDKGKMVVARVNGVEITMESFAKMTGSLGMEKAHEPESASSLKDAKQEALNQLIVQELAYQKAKSEGLTVEKKVIDDALAEMKRKLGGEEKLKEFIEKERISEEELSRRIERHLTLRRIFMREIMNKVSVSEEETRKEYEKEKESHVRQEKVTVVDVVFFLRTGDADSLRKAEEIRKKIDDDKEKNPSNLVSDGVFVVQDMEVKESQGKELYDAAKKLKVGELSGVFEADGNLHVIKLKEYTPYKQFTFEEVKSRIEGKSRVAAMKKRLEEWGAELIKDAKIEIIEPERREK